MRSAASDDKCTETDRQTHPRQVSSVPRLPAQDTRQNLAVAQHSSPVSQSQQLHIIAHHMVCGSHTTRHVGQCPTWWPPCQI